MSVGSGTAISSSIWSMPIIRGKVANLFLQDNGLLYANGRETPISWIDAVDASGRPITARTGYLSEYNSLWYNVLLFTAEQILVAPEQVEVADRLKNLAAKTAASFKEMFLNDYGYLFDYVDANFADWSVRPNILFALSLDYSPLEKSERKKALDVVTRELLTPKGIRTLSPKSHGYSPIYVGNEDQRANAYFQGSARPWLMGAYADAYLKLFGISGVSFLERMLIGYEEEMSNTCIGTISELFDGNPPYAGRGGISFAANVGEILRVLRLLKKYNHI